MTRIASYAAHQNIIQQMLRSQKSLNDLNVQLTSDTVAQQYQGISTQAQLLLNYENQATIVERYQSNNNTADFRLETATVTLQSMENTFTDMRKLLKDFDADSPDAQTTRDIQDWAFRTLVNIESYLNNQADGRYMFSGSRVSTRPVDLGLTSLEAFQEKYDGYHVKYPETRDAHLARFSADEDTNNLDSGPYVDAGNWMTFHQDDDGDQFSSGSGTIQAPSSLFDNLQAGATVNVSDTTGGLNDGSYTIESVNGDTVTINTVMLTDETARAGFANESLTGAHGATVTTGRGTTLTDTETGDLTINGTGATLTAATAGAFSAIGVGDHIQLAGSSSNDGTYEVTSVAGDTLTLATNNAVSFDLADGTSLAYANTGQVTFDRSADTITANTANAFSGVSVGEVITVSGSGQNDGTYTVTANDGTTLTVETNKLSDQGVTSGGNFFDFPAGGEVVFDSAGSTITAQDYGGNAIANVFSDYKVGDSFTVASTSVDQTLDTEVVFTDVGAAGTDTIQIKDSGSVNPVVGAFNGAQVGDTINISGYGNYTVNWVSDDASTIRVDEDILATSTENTNSQTISGANIDDFVTKTNLAFGAGTNTITLQDSAGGTVTNNFADMSVGMEVTISGATTGSNDGTYRITNIAGGVLTVENTDGTAVTFTGENSNAGTTISAAGNDGTYTVASVASDGSSITVDSSTPLVGDQTVSEGATLSNSTRNLSYTTGNRLLIDDTAETIQIVNAETGNAVSEAVSGLAAGMTIQLSGTQLNDGFYKIGSVDSTTGTITLDSSTPITGGDENFLPSSAANGTGRLQVFGTTGTMSTGTDYYKGDESVRGHRVDFGRTIDPDVTAIHPAFERVIRALSIVAQGEFGTAGGLDQNIERIQEAEYLLDMSLGTDLVSPPPYGTEQSGDIKSLISDISFNRLVIKRTIEKHETVKTRMAGLAGDIENIDRTEVITKLLSQRASVEASYQAISRVQTLSLTNYL